MTGLIIRHPAFYGVPGIDLRLTSSAQELCDYLGLDLEKWREGFDSELDVWRWMTTVEEGGKLKGAYRRMVRPRAVRQVGHKSKLGALDQFVDFLRETKHGEGWEGMVKIKFGEVRQADQYNTILPAPESSLIPDSDTPDKPSPAEEKEEEDPDNIPESTPVVITQWPVTPTYIPHPFYSYIPTDVLDPDNPAPLDPRAESALRRWGKMEAYEALLAEKRAVATVLYSSQQKRIENKQKALDAAKRKEETDALKAKRRAEEEQLRLQRLKDKEEAAARRKEEEEQIRLAKAQKKAAAGLLNAKTAAGS
jgi:hypothetical protein